VNLLSGETRARLILRAVVLVCPVLALLAAYPAQPRGWFLVLTIALAVGFAAMPDSAFGTACLGLVVVWWAIAVADGVPLSAVPAGLLLLAAHVAALLLSYGPAGLAMGVALLRRWLRRTAGVAVVVPLVWLFAVVVEDQPEPPGVWLAGLACAIVLCVVAATAVTMRDPQP
jgi:hypothetical protein